MYFTFAFDIEQQNDPNDNSKKLPVALYATRLSGDANPFIGKDISPDGEWTFTFKKVFFDKDGDNKKFIDNVKDIIIVPTIMGTVRWNS